MRNTDNLNDILLNDLELEVLRTLATLMSKAKEQDKTRRVHFYIPTKDITKAILDSHALQREERQKAIQSAPSTRIALWRRAVDVFETHVFDPSEIKIGEALRNLSSQWLIGESVPSGYFYIMSNGEEYLKLKADEYDPAPAP